MSAEIEKNYHPIKFLDQLKGNNHIVLLYDDERYADVMIARYFMNGLEKGGSCIFFTDEEPEAIEKRLSAQRIDVEKYKKSNSLRIFRTERSDDRKLDVLKTLKTIRSESTKGMKGPFRFVGRTITDIESTKGMLQGMSLEKTGQEHFAEFDNSQMCYYDVRRMERTKRDEWIKGLLDSHHQVIYASKPDKAVAFETLLLDEE
jgi:DcmR-like sensory protein